MSALDHALAWVQGERMENAAASVLAVLLVISTGLLWKFAVTPAGRALIVPLLVFGLYVVANGIASEIRNVQRIDAFSEAHARDPVAFVERETARVEGFMGWYLYTFVAGSVLIAGGLAMFLLVPSPTLKAIGLTMIVIGTTALFFDFFSKARATLYLEALTALAR